MWQELRAELRPQGVEVVTVALDTGGAEAAGPFIDAAAHFALGQHLHWGDDLEGARAHFREAHRLDPGNWTYRRQAWSFEDPLQGPTEHYDSDWLSDVKSSGAENYYPLPDL